MEKYSVAPTWRLRDLCIRKEWFTGGDVSQYNKLFDLNAAGAPLSEIALTIWLCSDESNTREEIQAELEAEKDEYLHELAEERQAEAEADAWEVYTGYLD